MRASLGPFGPFAQLAMSARLPTELTERQAAHWLAERAPLPLAGASPLLYLEIETSGLALDKLETAWSCVIAAHPELCAVVNEQGQLESMGGRYASPMRRVDLRSESEPVAVLDEVRRLLLEENLWLRQRPCRLSATLLGDNRARLHLQINSARIDAFSVLHLLRDWQAAFTAPRPKGCKGVHPAPPHQRTRDEEKDLGARSRAFWEARAPGLPPPLELPLLQSPQVLREPRYDRLEKTFSPALVRALEEQAEAHGSSLSTALSSAFAAVLSACSQHPQFTLALASFDAEDAPYRGARIGDGSTLSLVAVDAASELPFSVRARKMAERFREAHAHRHGGALTAARRAPGGNGYPLLFTDLLDADGFSSATSWLGNLQLVRSRSPQLWLDCQVRRERGALSISWDHPRGLFDPSMLQAMFDAWSTLVSALIVEEAWQAGTGWIEHELLAVRANAMLSQPALG